MGTCTRCGNDTCKNLLTVKKTSFLEEGLGGRTLRSRVVDHLCPTCVASDPDWNKQPYSKPKVAASA